MGRHHIVFSPRDKELAKLLANPSTDDALKDRIIAEHKAIVRSTWPESRLNPEGPAVETREISTHVGGLLCRKAIV